MIKWFNLLVMLFLLGVSFALQSQELSPLYKKYKDKYPNAQYVCLKNEIEIDIRLKNDSIEIIQKINEHNLYLSTGANFGSKRAIHYSSFFKINNVKAATLVYKDNRYKELPVVDFVENDDVSTSFYDDSKTINFIYPQLQKGAKTTLSYTQKISNPRFLNALYFGSYAPIALSKFKLSVDNGIELELKKFNMDSVDIKFSKTNKKNKTVYTWETNETEAYNMDTSAPNFRSIVPHVIPVITAYKTDNERKQLSGSVADLYNWYYTLVKDVNTTTPSVELSNLVNDLIKDKKTDLERVKAIYYWTQENIKYIAFEYALGGFVPREANDVFRKKYGDCKDNSSILYEMLKIANLEGHLTWIGTRSIPYTYNQVPTPAVDNHMILSYIDGDQIYYLDATGRYTPLGMPSSFIQGKEALIGFNKDDFKVSKVPIVEANRNYINDSVYIKIDNEKIIGKGRSTVNGYPKTNIFLALEKLAKKEDLREFYTYQLGKGNNYYLIEEFNELNKYEYEADFIVDYSFSIGNYVQSFEKEVYVNLNMNRDLSRLKDYKKRNSGKQFEYQVQNEITTTLEIPENMTLSYLPENFEISTSYFECKITYKAIDNRVNYKLVASQKFLELSLEAQKELNGIIEKIEKNFKEVVILTQK